MTIILLLVLLIFIGLFLYRLSGNKGGSGNKWRYLLVIIILGGIFAGGFVFFKNQKGITRCPTTLSPDDFTLQDFQDENSVASIFHDKDYKRKVSEEDRDGKKITFYNYELYSSFSGDLIDHAFYRSDVPGKVRYVIKERKKYYNFFNYIRALGGDTIIPENFKNYANVVGDHPSLRYKNCIFCDLNYISANDGYTISISSYSTLKPK